LTFSGTISHNSSNGTSAAYLYGKIRASNGTIDSTNENYSTPTSTSAVNANVNLVTPVEISGIVIPSSGPSSGLLSIETTLIGYNVTNLDNTVATIQIVSIDGIVVNISHLVSCKIIATSNTYP